MQPASLMAIISTAAVATGSKPLFRDGSSARIEMKVEAHNAAPVPTDAMNSQPYRVVPAVARARAKWRMPTQVPNRHTETAKNTSIWWCMKEVTTACDMTFFPPSRLDLGRLTRCIG